MHKFRTIMAALAAVLCIGVAVPSPVLANEIVPDSTPTATIAPDETPGSSVKVSTGPTASPKITAAPDETPAAEETASPEASALPEATPDVTASPEATPDETETPESPTSYDAAGLSTLGKTPDALTGTWYARESSTTITYDANGGSGTMETQTLNAVGNLRPVQFTRGGYLFTGWNTEHDGSGTAYADQAEFTPTGSDITLYAQWKVGVELPESGYPGDPSSRIAGLVIAAFGLILLAVARDNN